MLRKRPDNRLIGFLTLIPLTEFLVKDKVGRNYYLLNFNSLYLVRVRTVISKQDTLPAARIYLIRLYAFLLLDIDKDLGAENPTEFVSSPIITLRINIILLRLFRGLTFKY